MLKIAEFQDCRKKHGKIIKLLFVVICRFFRFFAHNIKKTIVEFIWWSEIVILTNRNSFLIFKNLGPFSLVFQSAVFRGGYFHPLLSRAWVGRFFRDTYQNDCKNLNFNFSQDAFMPDYYKVPKNRFLKKWALFPRVTINIDI